MKSLNEAVSYPRASDEWVQTTLIGGLFVLTSFLLLPLFLVYGYLVRAARETLAENPEPPVFDGLEELLVNGIKAWVISLVYGIVPLIVGGITVGSAVASFALGGDVTITTGALLFGLSVTFVLFVLFGYVAAAALVNFAAGGRFADGFALGQVWTIVRSRTFAVAWLTTVGLFLAAGFLTALVNSIPFLGIYLGAVVNFYVAVVAATLWASGYSDIEIPPERTRSPGTDETPT